MLEFDLWSRCSLILKEELAVQLFNTWIRPLKALQVTEDQMILQAPNRFICNWIEDKFLAQIQTILIQLTQNHAFQVSLQVGDAIINKPIVSNAINVVSTNLYEAVATPPKEYIAPNKLFDFHEEVQPSWQADDLASSFDPTTEKSAFFNHYAVESNIVHQSHLMPEYTFDTFIEGKSNSVAKAAALGVVANPGGPHNPLFIYGSVGLGKTHLMHAVGNELLRKNPQAKILYIHSDKYVADMVKAYQLKSLDDFKSYYHGLDALLVDDIQFFANKEGTQEQFFSAFNALLNGRQQIILTSDKYPKEIKGLDERLKSRFSWGLSVVVEPPELEARVAILLKKAEQMNTPLSRDAAFFIAQKIRSNVRELEGALKRVVATAEFRGRVIDIELIKESLKDLFSIQDRLISIENIQKTVAEYYKIKIADLLSKRRTRSVTRPRQVAMSIAKELTNHSLPEIGDAFGGRDHTTVLHACKKVKELQESNTDIDEDVKNLLRILTS